MRSAERSPDCPGSARARLVVATSAGEPGSVGSVPSWPPSGHRVTAAARVRATVPSPSWVSESGADPDARDWMAAGRVTAAVR